MPSAARDPAHRTDNLRSGTPADTVLVVPCFNEEDRLPVAVLREGLEQDPHLGLVLVDDGSTDATLGRLAEVRRGFEARVHVESLPHNAGKGAAVRHGILRALGGGPRFVGYWDADLATPLPVLADLVAVLRARPACHAVLGSRVRLLGRRIERRALRHYLGRVWATAASVVLRMPVYDTQCGAKLFRAGGPLAAALEAPFASRWAFDVELLARLRATTGCQDVDECFVEHPLVAWRDVAGSKLTAGAALRSGLDLARIAWRVRRGARPAVSPVADRPPAPTAPR